MSTHRRSRSAIRRRRSVVVLVVAVAMVAGGAAIATGFGGRSSASIFAPPLTTGLGTKGDLTLGADGSVPDGVTVFDDDVPAVANLDPDLLTAFRRAATDASADGVTFIVNSGWRSPEYQDRLLRDAVTEYGSEAGAARWVATPQTSPHVQGKAVDVGRWDALDWLTQHGAGYGLCQIYANEPWHYELRPDAVTDGCPAMYADPTHDPRMQQ